MHQLSISANRGRCFILRNRKLENYYSFHRLPHEKLHAGKGLYLHLKAKISLIGRPIIIIKIISQHMVLDIYVYMYFVARHARYRYLTRMYCMCACLCMSEWLTPSFFSLCLYARSVCDGTARLHPVCFCPLKPTWTFSSLPLNQTERTVISWRHFAAPSRRSAVAEQSEPSCGRWWCRRSQGREFYPQSRLQCGSR